jgi:hypothetical protein
LKGARGKAVKVISELLKDLPAQKRYRVIFMRRTLDEVLASQKTMLKRRNEDMSMPDQKIRELFVAHLEEVEAWLKQQKNMSVMFVSYNKVVANPKEGAHRINDFLDGILDEAAMVKAVEPDLYRNKA